MRNIYKVVLQGKGWSGPGILSKPVHEVEAEYQPVISFIGLVTNCRFKT